MNKKPGLAMDQRYFEHVIEQPSLENPGRLRNLYLSLQSPDYNGRFRMAASRPAAMEDILSVHSQFYVDQIREYALNEDPFHYDRDTYLMDATLYTACLAAGGCIALADDIYGGKINTGFAAVRPPGHHAESGRGMGFCVLNNAAVTARYLQRIYGLERILICDFDAHHGNGTQEIFYESDQVLVVSLHQRNMFPFSGRAEELGRGRGVGYNVNVPVHAQFGDPEYTFLLGRLVGALAEQFMPQIILVSAGFDGHADDAISKIQLSTGWFAKATHLLKQFARDACAGRLLFILEGGYYPVSLENCVLACLDSLADPEIEKVGIVASPRAERILADHPARTFWSF
jgi:acetoin utilization deacetylase AcuC-like enzyme